jgi:hypothetical protein
MTMQKIEPGQRIVRKSALMSAAQSFEVGGRSQRGWLSESIEAAIEAEAIGSVVVRARESSPSSRKWPHGRILDQGETAKRAELATTRSFPPQRRQTSISMAKTRLRRSA